VAGAPNKPEGEWGGWNDLAVRSVAAGYGVRTAPATGMTWLSQDEIPFETFASYVPFVDLPAF